MAENLRSYEEILSDLFAGKDAALDKFSKVRHTKYEIIDLWEKQGVPLSEIGKAEKAYFSQRFLSGQRIDKIDKKFIDDAITRLKYACGIAKDGTIANTGCYARCHKLVNELNAATAKIGLAPVENVTAFIDWLTFNYTTPTGNNGTAFTEPGYGFEIRIFHDKENRTDFYTEVKNLAKEGKRMSMQDIYRIVDFKRRHAKAAPAKPKVK